MIKLKKLKYLIFTFPACTPVLRMEVELNTEYLLPQDIPAPCERLLLDEYSFCQYRQSTIDPSKFIKSDLRLICPRCKTEQDCPPYGKFTHCVECKLLMFIHGSELICYPELHLH